MATHVVLFARSGADPTPSIDEQLDTLRQIADANNWQVAAAHADTNQIAPRGRDRRPGMDALLQQVRSSGLDLVAAHSSAVSVDR